jgi:hypothetical protein
MKTNIGFFSTHVHLLKVHIALIVDYLIHLTSCTNWIIIEIDDYRTLGLLGLEVYEQSFKLIKGTPNE